MNEVNDEIKLLAEHLHARQLSRVALFLLESHRPLFMLFSYIGVSLSPLFSFICTQDMRATLLKVFSSRDSLEMCTQYLTYLISEGEHLHE